MSNTNTNTNPIFTDCGALDGRRTRLFRDEAHGAGVEWCYAVDYEGDRNTRWYTFYPMPAPTIEKMNKAGMGLVPFGTLTRHHRQRPRPPFQFRVWLMADGLKRWQVYVPADDVYGAPPVPAEDTLVSVAPYRYRAMIRRAGPGWWHDKHRAWEPMHRHLTTAKGEARGTLYAEMVADPAHE